jgi:CheY-like chemotaxis protein
MAEGVLHDLSNILTGVIGMAEIELGTQGGPLQEAINRMVQLTHTLRDYTAGRPKKAAPFRLKPLLTSACSLIRHRENASAQLKLHEQFTALTDIEVVGNEGQIFEVVLNLLVNAVEATAGLPVPEIRVRTSLADGRVTVTVEDNGRGVPPSIAIAIFDPYASTKGRGRGLGLSVSRQIAHAHHGELRLAPAAETAGGACFQLELPARAIATGLPFAKDPAPAAKRFILVTEDDPDVQRLIERAVGDIGLQVIWHRPGEALPRILHRSRESLAAAVVDSGDLNAEHGSVAALRQLSPSLPILSISAALEDRGKRMNKWGVVEHLPKQFDSDDFVEALYAALTNTGLDAAAPPGPTAHPTSR